jgi:hypothetical protein
MKTTELKKIMMPNSADIQGQGIVEFYTPNQVVEILRLLGVVEQSEHFYCFNDIPNEQERCKVQCDRCKNA